MAKVKSFAKKEKLAIYENVLHKLASTSEHIVSGDTKVVSQELRNILQDIYAWSALHGHYGLISEEEKSAKINEGIAALEKYAP